MRGLALFSIALAITLGLVACGGYGSSGGSGSGSSALELDDNYFQPKTLKGAAGKKITVELKNEGKAEHNFTLSDQGIDQDLEPGKTAEVTVTVPKSRTLTFYCKYHRSQGMTGTLQPSSSNY